MLNALVESIPPKKHKSNPDLNIQLLNMLKVFKGYFMNWDCSALINKTVMNIHGVEFKAYKL